MSFCCECDLPIVEDDHRTASDLAVHPWCCPDCNGPELLLRHELPMPAGTAVVITSRPGPDAKWTTTVTAPGLDVDGYQRETGPADNAYFYHYQAINITRQQIAMIPVITITKETSR